EPPPVRMPLRELKSSCPLGPGKAWHPTQRACRIGLISVSKEGAAKAREGQASATEHSSFKADSDMVGDEKRQCNSIRVIWGALAAVDKGDVVAAARAVLLEALLRGPPPSLF